MVPGWEPHRGQIVRRRSGEAKTGLPLAWAAHMGHSASIQAPCPLSSSPLPTCRDLLNGQPFAVMASGFSGASCVLGASSSAH